MRCSGNKLLISVALLVCSTLYVSSSEAISSSKTKRKHSVLRKKRLENVCERSIKPIPISCYCSPEPTELSPKIVCWIGDYISASDPFWNRFQQHNDTQSLSLIVHQKGVLTDLPQNSFGWLHNLRVLAVEYANLTTIPANIFPTAAMENLKNLTLYNDGIMTIPDRVFAKAGKLEQLILKDNYITRISRYTLYGLVNLQLLDLSKNNLSIIEADTFAMMPFLEELLIDQNELATLHDRTFTGLQSLRLLNASFNMIETIDGPIFRHLIQLVHLSLQQNSIMTISSDAFHGLHQLRFLNLDQNELKVLDGRTMFARLAHLQWLNLEDNHLKDFNANATPFEMHLINNKDSTLLLEGNPIHCSCFLQWLEEISAKTTSHSVRRQMDRLSCCISRESVDIDVESVDYGKSNDGNLYDSDDSSAGSDDDNDNDDDEDDDDDDDDVSGNDKTIYVMASNDDRICVRIKNIFKLPVLMEPCPSAVAVASAPAPAPAQATALDDPVDDRAHNGAAYDYVTAPHPIGDVEPNANDDNAISLSSSRGRLSSGVTSTPQNSCHHILIAIMASLTASNYYGCNYFHSIYNSDRL